VYVAPKLVSLLNPFRRVGGGEENMDVVGVEARARGESGICRFGGCEEGGGVIDEGGGGELYFVLLKSRKDVVVSAPNDCDGNDGFPMSIEEVGDMARGIFALPGRSA
jgi:hypothetical protein